MSEGWWYRASTEERLAQIDGAIELGMTSAQCALNCGCLIHDVRRPLGSGAKVKHFAVQHGRHFPRTRQAHKHAESGIISRNGWAVSRKQARIDAFKDAFLSGEPVDIWRAP